MPDALKSRPYVHRRGPDGRMEVSPDWETLIERQIREAYAEGQFDSLPHQGEPLPNDENPYAGDWSLAFRLLKNAGAAPPWDEAAKVVRELLEKRDAILERAAAGPEPSEPARGRNRAALADLVADINAAIARVNAEAPTTRQHRRLLVLADELARHDEACRRWRPGRRARRMDGAHRPAHNPRSSRRSSATWMRPDGAPHMSTQPGSPSRPTQLWVTRDGTRLHCLDWGGPADGPLVLLLHGVAGNALVWNEVAPILRASLPDHRVVALDTRDGGRSDHPATGYALPDFVADVLAVADALGAARVSLVGHSRGGWLAACMAALHPDRVSRLVLLDPARISFGSDDAANEAYRRFAGGLGPFTSREEALAAARTEEPTALWTPTRVHALLDNLVDLPDGSVVSRLPGHVLDQLRAARAEGERVSLEGVCAPTLLILAAGLGDQHLANKMVYAERIPGTRVERVMGTHFLHTDAPETVARLIIGHLGA